MKFRWEKKYLYWGVTALLVVIGGLLAYYLIFHGGNFKDHLQNLLHICMPILDGFILAWLMCPLVNAIEHFALYPARDRLISQKPSLQKKRKQLTSYCRGISIVLTLCFVLFLVYGFFRVVIPQIIGSIQSIVGQFPSYVKNVSDWAAKLLADNPDIETTVSDLIDHYSTDLENFLNKTMMPQINAIVKTVSLSMLSFAKAVWNLVIGLILDSAIIGVLCFVVVSIMKMPYPMLISVIVGVTNIIPFFGPFIGAVPCALLILMVNPMQCLYFIIFIWILQQFDGNFLGPKILGDSTGLSGFWIIFSITIFSGLMGVPGMILGVPIFAVFYALIKRYVNRSLQKKGMSDKTEEYQTLDYVDVQTGSFISKPEDKPARHRTKQFSFRNFKEDLKTFIPHPTEHPDEKAQTTSDNAAPAVESNRKTEDSSSEQSKK